jgi:DnaJ family protein C protein 19
MAFLAILIIAALAWAVWKKKLQSQQLLPILLGIGGAFLAARGSLLLGLGAIAIAAAWYRGMTSRLFGKGVKDNDAAALDAARVLLGVSRFDTAERIRGRHRALISQNHPDAGGSDAQAAALNKARDLLLDDLNDKRL